MMIKKYFSHRSCYDDHDHANERSLANVQKTNIGYSISRMFNCDLCHRIFTSGAALGGHKSHHHRSDHLLQQPLTKKHVVHDYGKVFSSNKALCGHMRSHHEKGIESPTTSFPISSLEQQSNICDHDQFQVGGAPPAIDLSKYLPSRSHQTKKRSISRRNMIDQELLNAAHILLDMSNGGGGGGGGGDDDHTPKRLKLSSIADDKNINNEYIGDNDETLGTKVKGTNKNNREKSLVLRFKIQPSSSNDIGETPETRVKDNNKTKKSLVLRFKIPHSLSTDNKILQTSEGCSQHGSIDIEEMKKNNEGETGREQSQNELKSERVVRNFDLNELPTDDAADE